MSSPLMIMMMIGACLGESGAHLDSSAGPSLSSLDMVLEGLVYPFFVFIFGFSDEGEGIYLELYLVAYRNHDFASDIITARSSTSACCSLQEGSIRESSELSSVA